MTDSKDIPKHTFQLDLVTMLEIVYIGVRRASAFIKLGLVAVDAPIPENFSLGTGNIYSFWPSNLDEETKKGANQEFQSWLIGSCLKELDQYFAYFLDDVWFKCDLAELHNTRVPSNLVVGDKKFLAITNSAAKLEMVGKRIGAHIYADSFVSLSLARNCLSHGMGRVRTRDSNGDDQLSINWLAPHVIVDDGKQEISLSKALRESETLYLPNGGNVFVKFENFSKSFKVGEKINIQTQQIAEICWFYIHQATKIHTAMLEYLEKKGIVDEKTKSVIDGIPQS